MARGGRNETTETERVSRMEKDNVRPDGLTGTGVNPFGGRLNQVGYGRSGMQRNGKMKMPKNLG